MTTSDAVANPLPPNTLLLNDLLVDSSLNWQVHNCKINEQTVTQDAPLPFLYHYDTLSEDLKAAHPLTPPLLARFNDPMSATAAAALLQLPADTITAPWQVKIIGTLVLFCESLQVAVRLRFTNSAKALDPIYTSDKAQAVTIAMRDWHFFGDVFVLNKCSKPIAVLSAETFASSPTQTTSDATLNNEDSPVNSADSLSTDIIDASYPPVMLLPRDQSYQFVPPLYSVALLSELETHKATLPELDKAIQARIS